MDTSIELRCLAGSNVDRVSRDAQRIVDVLGVSVEFTFNDVICVAVPGGSSTILAKRQQIEQARELSRPMDYRRASSAV